MSRPSRFQRFLVGAISVAGRFGLVALIAQGYRALAWMLIAIFIRPLMTVGLWRPTKGRAATAAIA